VKENKTELIVGGTILIAIFILIAGVLWLKAAMITSKMVQYSVMFTNVGTLQMGDPVMVNGVKKGSVSSISLKGTRVVVVINLDKEVELTDASRITIQNIGLMGERMVGIQLGDGGKPYKPNGSKPGEITYIDGYFDTGIAEVMGMVGTVLGDVRTLVGNVSVILANTVGDTSFYSRFGRIVLRLDTVTAAVGDMLKVNRPAVDRSMAAVEKLTAGVNGILDSNKEHVNTLMANSAELSAKAVIIAARVDSLSQIISGMVDRIDKGEGTAGLLLKDDRLFYDLKNTVSDLDTLVNVINKKGIKLEITKLHWPF
jgi:phospholipid/cholesterol/gamma-HCH transport system substrate-binding protein